jgi:uncharacterized alkaline shock family protein YloU
LGQFAAQSGTPIHPIGLGEAQSGEGVKMDQNVKGDFGTIRIHEKVIRSLTTIATKEVEGVVKLGTSLKGMVFNIFKSSDASVIKVNIDTNNDVSIAIPVIVAYGYNLPEVASRIQENVRRIIEKSTDLNIKQIDVNIQAVEREAKSENIN